MNPLVDKYSAFRARLAEKHELTYPQKTRTRKEISSDVEKFLADGGTIHQVRPEENAFANENLLANHKLRYQRAGGSVQDPTPEEEARKSTAPATYVGFLR